jgi:ADP-ribosylglycohydrolase
MTNPMTNLREHYAEQVYAGVLGKLIGVYLGRPFEGWPYRDILKKLGPIDYYVHDRLDKPLVVADDDITGTFTFLRALEDHAETGAAITAEQIGQSWMNYLIENRTILWWGGLGMSTEHTAYLRLKHGIPAPRSGSAELNGKLVADQIGAQIFIDGWAMVSPGNPDQAASLAKRAGSVSHDGEAVYAAQVIAAMEAQAFVETNLNKLLDIGVSYIPKDSLIHRLIDDLRNFRQTHDDWQQAMTDLVEKRYGYDKYGGNCHVIPNHALIILALLWGDDDFQKSLMIANTCGWDTDCNSGNVGCLLGIKNGLAGIDAGPDWRGPVADRVFMPTADAGTCITDAVAVARNVENLGRQLAGAPLRQPKNGAKFSFDMPGSVQGFTAADDSDAKGATSVAHDARRLKIGFAADSQQHVARASTPTFMPPDSLKPGGYGLIASPTLYPTQLITAQIQACPSNAAPIRARLYISHYNGADELQRILAPERELRPGESALLEWTAPQTGGQPIAEIGFEFARQGGASDSLLVEHLNWAGTPSITFAPPEDGGKVWPRAWAEGTSTMGTGKAYYLRIIQNEGRGLLTQGTRDWRDYSVRASFYPVLARFVGVAARVQGMRRYYALLLCVDNHQHRLRLVKMRDTEQVLAEVKFDWTFAEHYDLRLDVNGSTITGSVNGKQLLSTVDSALPLDSGAVGLVIEEGRAEVGPVEIIAV